MIQESIGVISSYNNSDKLIIDNVCLFVRRYICGAFACTIPIPHKAEQYNGKNSCCSQKQWYMPARLLQISKIRLAPPTICY